MHTKTRKSPELSYSPAPPKMLFAENLLSSGRPRMHSDITLESTVDRAFGVAKFSLMPIDKPLGKQSYLAPLFLI